MLNIKYILLLTLVCFCYPLKHCLASIKECGMYKTTPTIPNCLLEYRLSGTCKVCKNNYTLTSKYDCINYPNCYFYLDNQCGKCNDYYNFDSDKNCVINFCKEYDNQDKTKCSKCYSGYYLNENLCQKINIKNCAEIDENNQCSSCFSGYKLNDKKECEVEKFIEGCKEINTDGTCKECEDDYKLENGECTFECEKTVYEKCLACEDGYYISSTFHCRSISGIIEDDSEDIVTDAVIISDDSSSGNIIKGININFVLIYLLLALV